MSRFQLSYLYKIELTKLFLACKPGQISSGLGLAILERTGNRMHLATRYIGVRTNKFEGLQLEPYSIPTLFR